jgi:predicted ATPase/DNA-binding XRE family transcriptional regulator
MEGGPRLRDDRAPADLSFGEVLCAYRAGVGLTQEQLADRAGLSADAISLLERNVRSSPRASTVRLLAQALGLSSAELDAFAAAARRKRPGPAVSLRIPPDLRLQSTQFVGREQELAAIRALLGPRGVRLLTLTGPPGAGKTRLALEAATVLTDDYRDGCHVVTLARLAESGLVMPAIAQALGLGLTANESMEAVVGHCRTRQALLVLDNFEHVLAAGLELVELMVRCPGLRLLVTSRAPLRLRPEHEFPLAPLPLPGSPEPEAMRGVASVNLFLERAAAVAPSFRLTAENAAAVAEICRRLGGLPLALELAAPWLRLLAPEELLERLDRQLFVLVNGPRDLPERQRTMRAAVSWSWGLLEPEPGALLRRFSVFAGGAPLDGVERVCQSAGPLPGGVLRSLGVLAEQSLVQLEPAAPGERRLMVTEVVREYGRELLSAAGELETTARAHLAYYADMAARARRETGGHAQALWLERLEREDANVQAALAWAAQDGKVETGLRLESTLAGLRGRAHRRQGGGRSVSLVHGGARDEAVAEQPATA